MTDRRDEFLLHMYDAFWDNISRAESTVWAIIAVYGAVIAGVGLAQSVLTSVSAAFALLIFGFLASCVAAAANSWFRRNLTLIGRIEVLFLEKKDYGSLIPENFRKHSRFWTDEYWTLLVLAYPVISMGLALVLIVPKQADQIVGYVGISGYELILLTIIIGSAVTAFYSSLQWWSYKKFLRDTPTAIEASR